jgi:hypothetical protein
MIDDKQTRGMDTSRAGSRGSGSRLRSVLVGVLVLLCSIVVLVTGVTWWAHYTVMDTDGYMNIVGPVGQDPAAIQNLSQYIGSEVVSVTDLQKRISDALAAQGQASSAPTTAQVQDFIAKGAATLLSTPEAYQVWLGVNRVSHQQLVALLRGQTNQVYAEGDDVNLNLLPLISQALTWVDQQLPSSMQVSPPVITAAMTPEEGIQTVGRWAGQPLPADFGQLTLIKASALGSAQTAVAWFDRLMWILPVVVAALMALTLWVSRRRGRTAIALAIGAAIAILVARGVMALGSQYLTSQVAEDGGRGIIKQVVSASLGPLTTITIAVCVVAVVVAVVIWFLGRRAATASSTG